MLDKELGVSGINIVPVNVKVIDKKYLGVTDLCADICKLNKRPNGE